jgi:hypothetical protein
MAPIVKNVYYQVDTWQGPWIKADSNVRGIWTAVSPDLKAGVHIVYAWAGDGSEATSINASSPIIGQIAAYLFVVVPNASVDLSTTSLTFGSQPVGTTGSAQDVTLTNSGNASLLIHTMSVIGDFVQTNDCGASLAASGSCTIHVSFAPDVQGVRYGTLTISNSAGGSPHIVALGGTGTAPTVSLSANNLAFAKQPVGTTSSAQDVTLTNSGTASLAINSISVVGDFTQTNDCVTSLAAGENCTFQVAFAPGAPGTRYGMLAISDSAGGGSTQTVALSGTGSAAAVSLSPKVLNFVNQPVGTTSPPQDITLSNTGNDLLTIDNLSTTVDFVQTNDCGTSLAAGGTCTLHVSFAPGATGMRDGTLTISNSANGSPHIVALSGTSTAPTVSLSANTLTFSSQPVGTTSSTQDVILTNSGTASLAINNISVVGDFGQTNDCGTSLAAGGNCTIHVSFAPDVQGARYGTLTILDSANGSPHMVALSGTGTAPTVSLSANTLAFAKQPVGTTSSAQDVILTNSGTASMAINSISVSGDFEQTNNCAAALAPSANCTIQVSFAPGAPGTRYGMLAISDSAGGGSTQTVALSGTGSAAAVSLSPKGLNFGNQPVGAASSPQDITLSNTGNDALTIDNLSTSVDFAQTNDCGTSLEAGGTCTIHVSFAPGATGLRNGTLTISDSAIGSPHIVTLSGTGALPTLSLSVDTLVFTHQRIGTTSAVQDVTLTNIGTVSLPIHNIFVIGDFAQTNNCGASLAASASCTIHIQFKPTLGGLRVGKGVILYQGSSSPATVSLSGTGAFHSLFPLIGY